MVCDGIEESEKLVVTKIAAAANDSTKDSIIQARLFSLYHDEYCNNHFWVLLTLSSRVLKLEWLMQPLTKGQAKSCPPCNVLRHG